MARIPLVTEKDIPAKEKPAFDAFVKVRGANPNTGPYAIIGHMAEVAFKVDDLRRYLRDEGSVPELLQELVMITLARDMNCSYIWYAHAASARQKGLRGDIIDNLRERRPLTGLDKNQQAVVDYTLELLRNRKVSKPVFDAAMACLGQRGTVALTNLIACYAILAYNMNAFELEAPQHATEAALPV